MIMIKNLTPIINYEKLKVENLFYEMLTATVSHDMRTPLNSIIGLLNHIDKYVAPGEGQRFLSIIKNSSNFLLFLVNDLLDFFQIKNGKFKRNLKWVNMRESFKDLIDMFNVGA
jgi:signal transduction histidine kinase